jgi:pSer/pThr/pTyr-binding forkhead associated (FHA) protein
MSSYSSSSMESVSPYHSNQTLNESSPHAMLSLSHDHRPIGDDIRNSHGDRYVKVMLSCLTKSHPFQERHITLQEGPAHHVKIGRLVAKLKPTANNAIFDCKVLSRNHAIMWFEDGRVWIKDTKSSNGTFVNSQRLAKTGEEGDPREVVTGNIVQFGVEVVENQVTHDCILAQITVIDNSGNEIKKNENTREEHVIHSNHTQEQIFQATYYLSETLLREKALEEKVQVLGALLEQLEESAKHTWRVILNEDRLICKLQSMQQQLDIYSRDYSADTLQTIAAKAIEEREAIRTKTMEIYDAILLDKTRALEKMGELYGASSDDCLHLRLKCQELENNWKQLNEEYQSKCRDLVTIESKLHEVDDGHKKTIHTLAEDQETILERWKKDVEEMGMKLNELQGEREDLLVQLEKANLNAALRDKSTVMMNDHSCNTMNETNHSWNMMDAETWLARITEKHVLPSVGDIEEESLDSQLQECMKWLEQILDSISSNGIPDSASDTLRYNYLVSHESIYNLHELLVHLHQFHEDRKRISPFKSEPTNVNSISTETEKVPVVNTISTSSMNDAFSNGHSEDSVLSQSTSTDLDVITTTQCQTEILAALEILREYLQRRHSLSEGAYENEVTDQLETSSFSPALIELVDLTKQQVDSLTQTCQQLTLLREETEVSVDQVKEECNSLKTALKVEREKFKELERDNERKQADLEEAHLSISAFEEEKLSLTNLVESSYTRCMKLEELLMEEQTLRQDLQLEVAMRPETATISTNTDFVELTDHCTEAHPFEPGNDDKEDRHFRNSSSDSICKAPSTTFIDSDNRLVRQARLMSGLAAVPLMILLLAVMISIFMWLQSLNTDHVNK